MQVLLREVEGSPTGVMAAESETQWETPLALVVSTCETARVVLSRTRVLSVLDIGGSGRL